MTDTEMPSVTIEGGPSAGVTPDSALPKWLSGLPEQLRPYAALARWDRPAGIWLLLLPCWIGIAFSRIGMGWHWIDIWWAVLFFVGAVAMRGAGCTWNDIQDQDLDAGVERTASRPLPSGQVTTNQAYMWLGAQLFVGFLVWLCLPFYAKIVALFSIPLVAAYPFMKRLHWWPQAWLGLTFNWGVLVAAGTVSYIGLPTFILYLALAAWTIAYDTIYAIQDAEDDALIGVKSTARLFGDKVILGAFSFHIIAAMLAGFATWAMGAGRIGALTMMAFLAHGIWQSMKLRKNKKEKALDMFKANVWAGGILCTGLMLAAIAGGDRSNTAASAWEVMMEPGQIEMEKIRIRETIPDWMAEPGTTAADELTWKHLTELIQSGIEPSAAEPNVLTSEDLLPKWMRSTEE